MGIKFSSAKFTYFCNRDGKVMTVKTEITTIREIQLKMTVFKRGLQYFPSKRQLSV